MKIYFVDSFTNTYFKGNPAAVCFPEVIVSDERMQCIASEIGYSETAFLTPVTEESYHIRFFTPITEIPICGHATLAAARILFTQTKRSALNFQTKAKVDLHTYQHNGNLCMQFPLLSTRVIPTPVDLCHALGITTPISTQYNEDYKIILIEIENTTDLAQLQPNAPALLQAYSGINGVVVTAASKTDEYDFHYRYFWPWSGTLEDPVTGGVHTFLSPYWANKLHKSELNCYQSSSRGGNMLTIISEPSVIICGNTVITFMGEWLTEQ